MEKKGKLAPNIINQNEISLRKDARKIVKHKHLFNKRPTHLFMHEKCLTEIVNNDFEFLFY